jgi:hypothetical protein
MKDRTIIIIILLFIFLLFIYTFFVVDVSYSESFTLNSTNLTNVSVGSNMLK